MSDVIPATHADFLASTALAHVAIQEQPDGNAVDWMEKVSDEQYRTQGCFGRNRSGRRGLWKSYRSARSCTYVK